MKLIILKLLETLARAMFILLCIFSLPVEESGQFGIFVTLVALTVFFLGFERHIDIQRKFSAQASDVFDRAVVEAIWLYGYNYILVVPLFVILIVQWVDFSLSNAFLCVFIVIGEHVGNQSYLYSIVNIRYRNLVSIVAIKNIITFIVVTIFIFFSRADFAVATVLKVWAINSFIFTIFIFLYWMRFEVASPYERGISIFRRVLSQYKFSSYHFLIGLVAVLALQLDRLIVGSLLAFSDVGVYFRHIMLVSFMYQFFNIVSFNRVLPRIFSYAKNQSVCKLRKHLSSEYIKIIIFTSFTYLFFVAAYSSRLKRYFDEYEVSIVLLAVLFLSFIIRSSADLNGLIYNAKGQEKKILKFQILALFLGLIAFVGLTNKFGISGAVSAGVLSATAYLFLILYNFRFIGSESTNEF